MIRIMDGLGRASNAPGFDISTATAFLGRGAESYTVKAYDCGNGQIEATASRRLEWVECEWSQSTIQDHLTMMAEYRETHADELKQRHAERAAQRARKRVRLLCKAMGTNALMTLTYRACVTDLGLCKAHLKEFNRRLKRWLPGFQFVAGFERQKRGAWHVHIATSGIPVVFWEKNASGVPCKIKSYDLLRRIWLSVVGDLGGNVDLSIRKTRGATVAKIAAYISKYITKEFAEGDAWSNRWAKYGKCEVPEPVDLGVFANITEAVHAVFSLVTDSQSVGRTFLPRFKDFFFLAAEPPPC